MIYFKVFTSGGMLIKPFLFLFFLFVFFLLQCADYPSAMETSDIVLSINHVLRSFFKVTHGVLEFFSEEFLLSSLVAFSLINPL